MGRDMGDTTLACSKKPACVGHEDERMSNYRASSPAPMSSREAAYALGRNGKGRVSPYDSDLQPEEFNAWVKGRNDRYSPLQVEQKRKSKVGKAFRDHGIEAFVASNFTAAGAAAGRPDPRLAANLVPASMWGKNVRAVVAEDTWHLLRSKFGATEVGPTQSERMHWPGKSLQHRSVQYAGPGTLHCSSMKSGYSTTAAGSSSSSDCGHFAPTAISPSTLGTPSVSASSIAL